MFYRNFFFTFLSNFIVAIKNYSLPENMLATLQFLLQNKKIFCLTDNIKMLFLWPTIIMKE